MADRGYAAGSGFALLPVGFVFPGVLVTVLLLQTAVLWLLHVPLVLQLSVVTTITLSTAAGWMVSRPLFSRIPDRAVRLAFAFLAGMVLAAMAAYFTLHRSVGNRIGLDTPRASVVLSLVLVAAVGIAAAVGFRRPPTAQAGSPLPAVVALVLAFGMSAATIYGAVNSTDVPHNGTRVTLSNMPPDHPLSSSTTPEWGAVGDFSAHLVVYPQPIVIDGLPLADEITHRHVQVWALSTTLAFDSYQPADPIQAMKVAALPLWASLLVLSWSLARAVLRLTRGASAAVIGAVLLFAPIALPPWDWSHSTYRGFIGAAGSIYHNLPQLTVVAMGMAGVVLIGVMVDHDRLLRAPYLGAAGFIAASFWFKPSLFVALGPALGLVSILWMRKSPGVVLGGWAILALPFIWRLGYSAATGLSYEVFDVVFSPFGGYLDLARPKVPAWIGSSDVGLATAILALSFAGWVLPVADWMRRSGTALKAGPYAWAPRLRAAALEATVLAALAIGTIAAVLFVEAGERRTHGNMAWPVMAAFILALPVLVRLTADIRLRRVRLAAWGVFGLHLAAGVVHLVRMEIWQRL